MPKWLILLVVIIVGLLGFAVGISVSSKKLKTYHNTVCFFELPREEIISKIESLGYHVDESESGGYKLWNREDYMVFRVTDNIDIGLNWLEPDYQRLYAISVNRTHVEHNEKNAKPILEIWRQILPEMVPLFKDLIKDHLSLEGQWFRDTDPRQYLDTDYVYGVYMNNKYCVSYEPQK